MEYYKISNSVSIRARGKHGRTIGGFGFKACVWTEKAMRDLGAKVMKMIDNGTPEQTALDYAKAEVAR